MFFMMGITDGRKVLDFNQTIICEQCGKYGRYQVIMTYTVLSLFFIPCLKWNRRYYVQTSCCHALYELDPEIGKRILRNEDVEILPAHLNRINGIDNRGNFSCKTCNRCGYETTEDFDFCPKCGNKF